MLSWGRTFQVVTMMMLMFKVGFAVLHTVFEDTYFTFFSDLNNMTFYVFFPNDVSKSRKKSATVLAQW